MTLAPRIVAGPGEKARPSLTLGHALLVFWVVASMLGLAWWLLTPQGVFFATGAMTSLVVSLPLIRRNSSILSPWALVAGITYFGCGVRGAAISAGIETTGKSLSQFLLLQRAAGLLRRAEPDVPRSPPS